MVSGHSMKFYYISDVCEILGSIRQHNLCICCQFLRGEKVESFISIAL